MKKIFSFLFISSFVIGLAVLAQTAQAATAGLTLSSDSNTYTVGQTFDVQVVLSVDMQDVVDGIDINYLHFTNYGTVLEIVSQTPGILCGDTLTNTFSNTEGWVNLSQVSGAQNYCSSAGAVMTINFRAKAAGIAVLSFDAAPGNGTDTNVASGGLDILNSAIGASFTINSGDAGAPTGCLIKINNDATATNSVNVSLNISGCIDSSGMGQMKFSNTGVDSWSVAENYNESTPVSWTLSPDDASDKIVYAQFSDSLGKWTGNITDAIKLDTTAPTGSILINGTDSATKNTAIVLTFSASDALSSPVSQMRFSSDNTDWNSAPIAYAVSASYNLTAGDGTKYVYVKFKDSLENWSSAFFDDIILDQTPPTITVLPAVSELTQTNAKINWTTNEASSSQVEYGLDVTYGNSTNFDANLVFSHSVSLVGLTANQTYHYRVKSKDDANNEQISADYTFLTSATSDATAPAAIVLQVANDPNNSETAVILTWTAPADDGADPISGSASSYDIRYSIAEITADNFASATVAISIPAPSAPGATETFTVIELARQTKYYFAAKAADEGPRWSTLSNVPSVETLDKTAPSKIDNLAVDILNTTDSKIKLTWTAPGDDANSGTAASYDLRYSIANITDVNFNSATQATGITAPKIADSTEVFEVNGLPSNTKYYFAIKTVDDKSNWSIISNIVSDTTKAIPPPADTTPPIQITTLVVSNRTSNSVTLTWIAPGDDGSQGQASFYNIRYSTTNITDNASFNAAVQATSSNSLIPKMADGTETFTINALSDVKYYFAIKTADEVPNWSLLFSNVAIAEDKTAPSAKGGAEVGSLKASEIKSTSVKLTWSAPGDDGDIGTATQYDLRYSIAQITTANWASATQIQNEPAPKIAGSTEILEITGLLPITVYYFALETADEAGNKAGLGENLSIITIATPPPADITSPAQIANLSSSAQTANSVTLTWTAPGDNGTTGQASSYNIRYSTSNITDGNFVQAVAAPNASINPKIAGQTESFTVTGLSASTKYYFAIKTSDEAPNVSGLSNVISATTLTVTAPPPPPPSPGSGPSSYTPPSDTTAPAKPAEFKAVSSETQISFSWKNPKDADFVRVKILRKDDKFSANSSDGQVIYEGNKESFIDKNLENKKTYYYAIFACDGAPNWSQAETLKITVSAKASANPEPVKPPVKEPDKIPLIDQKLEQPLVVKIEHKLKDKKPYVEISWQNPTNPAIKKINIWRSSVLCQRDSLITAIDLAVKPLKQYSDQLPKDQEYFYILSAVNAVGQESKFVVQWSSQSGKIVGYLTKFTSVDRDCDGLSDERERLYKSDSHKADTDGDGYLDGLEIESGFNPTAKSRSKVWDSNLLKRLKGKILLAPQFNGESYYAHPDNQKVYLLGRPSDAFAIMRAHGLGITNINLVKIPKNNEESEGDIKLRQQLSGKILLQVEEKGEAWYIYPDNLKRYYLGRPADAFAIMRSLSLGISNENLIKLDLQL